MRVEGLGFGVWGLGLRVEGRGFEVWGWGGWARYQSRDLLARAVFVDKGVGREGHEFALPPGNRGLNILTIGG